MALRLVVVVLAVAAIGLGVGSARDRPTATSSAAVATVTWVAAGPATARVVDGPIVRAAALASARRYARSRLGRVAFAVVEDRTPVRGYRRTAGYPSASVIKAMVMVAVLRRAGHRRLTSARRALLDPMITRSDNAAAIALWNELGAGALRRVAAVAGMRRFAIGAHLFEARIDASDQARFFLIIDRLVPRRASCLRAPAARLDRVLAALGDRPRRGALWL
jgi:beta-lactamase class A